jgi:ribosomal silencing factor RsfS
MQQKVLTSTKARQAQQWMIDYVNVVMHYAAEPRKFYQLEEMCGAMQYQLNTH